MKSQTAQSPSTRHHGTGYHASMRFDALRGLLAILVLIGHADMILIWRLTGENTAMAIGSRMISREAVMAFFLLSGYLITRSVRSNIAEHGHFAARDYVISRLARLYPPLIGALVLMGLVWLVIHGLGLPGAVHYGLPGEVYAARDDYSMTGSEIVRGLVMRDGLLDANGSLWTLYLEAHLYTAVLAFAAWRVKDSAPRILCALAGAAGLFAMRHAIPFACVWMIGAAFEIWPAGRRKGLVIAAAAGLASLALAILRPELLGSLMDTDAGRWAMLPPALMIAAFLFAAPPGWRIPMALVRTGDFSYSLYVIHWPLLLLALSLTQNWMQHSLGRALAVALVSVLVILPLAAAFAAVAERHKYFAKMLRTWLSRPQNRDLVPLVPAN